MIVTQLTPVKQRAFYVLAKALSSLCMCVRTSEAGASHDEAHHREARRRRRRGRWRRGRRLAPAARRRSRHRATDYPPLLTLPPHVLRTISSSLLNPISPALTTDTDQVFKYQLNID